MTEQTQATNSEKDMQQKRRKTVSLCLVSVVFMVGLAYASVPLYDLFCRVTGYGGTTNRADNAPQIISERVVRVQFDASLNRSMPWDFKAPQDDVELKIGETALVFYVAHNPTEEMIAGTATFNVTPQKAGYYFSKIDCFCFTEQVLKAGQTMDMPVTFFIDPEIINDPEMDDVKTITLSYTFFKSKKVARKKTTDSVTTPKG